ncbi:hypothetical protein TcYC6_0102930 [Trypanosoma cruzi]|nr:hypothetical protein TcYC6_0102930 [Trypanosoma cruzi]
MEGEKSRVQTEKNASDHLEATEAEAMDKKRRTALFPGKERKTTMTTELAEDECVKIDELPPVPPQDLSSFICDNPPNVFPSQWSRLQRMMTLATTLSERTRIKTGTSAMWPRSLVGCQNRNLMMTRATAKEKEM